MPTYSRLTREQRYTIESMLRKSHSQKSIAEAIGVHPSNVSRELRRGGMNRSSYCYVAAQRDADSREWKGVRICPELWKRVEDWCYPCGPPRLETHHFFFHDPRSFLFQAHHVGNRRRVFA